MGNYFSSRDKDEWKSDVPHATQTGTFCVVCGGPFDLEGEVSNMDPKDPKFEVRCSPFENIAFLSDRLISFKWLYHLRLVGRVEDVEHHVVASTGYS